MASLTVMPPSPFVNSDSEDVPAQMQGSNDCGLARDDVKPDDTMQESRPARPATALSEAGGCFSIDEESFLYAVDPPPLPPLFLASPSPEYLDALNIEPILKTIFERV